VKRRVLYVEDEPFLGKIVKETLENQNFEVCWITDGNMVIKQISDFKPEICVLDIMLPNTDGYTLCRQISSLRPDIPIIFLTAKVETEDLVKGFESGGTDYIRKPFSLEELFVRINNQLNLRTGELRKLKVTNDAIKIGKYIFFPLKYELHFNNLIIKLSQRDIEILHILVSGINRVTDRKELLMKVWGDDSFFNSRNLDVYIRKLRQYFSEDSTIQIQTLKGKGYLFIVPSVKN
jgi:two-component system response regulator VicR